jgi:predicted RNA binding protein YcfA (HicA-like mRNA interferase family)
MRARRRMMGPVSDGAYVTATVNPVRAREVEKRILQAGGELVRQRGSHRLFVVTRGTEVARTTVPYHGGDVPKGTLRAIERDLEPLLGKGWLR